MPALTANLAKFVATIDPGAVPERCNFGARIGMLDCIGTMIAGADEEAVKIVAQMVPAGWGGVGSVYRMESASYDVSFSRREIAGSGSCMLRAPAVFRSRGASPRAPVWMRSPTRSKPP